jgi:hypothetical protein
VSLVKVLGLELELAMAWVMALMLAVLKVVM